MILAMWCRSIWRAFPVLVVIAALAFAGIDGGFPDQAQAAGRNGQYEGVASCAGSTCHGRIEGDGAIVRQDELMHWQEPSTPGGAHSRAFSVLAGKRGQQIASTLGLGKATTATACLGCHATPIGANSTGQRFQTSDGVGCESCHGAASGWIASHYSVPATHASNVADGLLPLERPDVRASVCLDCHFGSNKPGQFVTHRMMAAGHPRISFELDLFSALQQHHDEDADYAARKGKTDHVRLWAVGQAEAIQRSLSLFAQPDFGMEGIFPEFYFYDCHSCHRPIHDGPDAVRTFESNSGRPIPFGMPPFNDENIILLSAVARTLSPAQAAGFDAASRDFHAAMGKGRPAVLAAASRLTAAAGSLSANLSQGTFGGNSAFQVIAAIGQKANDQRFTDYEGAVQSVMAVDTLLNALVQDGRITVGAAAGIRKDINNAYGAVRDPNGFRPSAFRSSLAHATQSIGVLR